MTTAAGWSAYRGTAIEVWTGGDGQGSFIELDASKGSYGIKQPIKNAVAGGYALIWKELGRNNPASNINKYHVKIYYISQGNEVQIAKLTPSRNASSSAWYETGFAFSITKDQLTAAAGAPIHVAFIPEDNNAYGCLLDDVKLLPLEFKTYSETVAGPDKAHRRNLIHMASHSAHYSSSWNKCMAKLWSPGGSVNLIDYLTQGAENRSQFQKIVKWRINGNIQNLDQLNLGSKPAEDKQTHYFVEVISKNSGGTIDRLIINVVPPETKTKFDTWHTQNLSDMGWLSHLPSLFKKLGNGNSDPEPFSWGINFWHPPDSYAVGDFYHPGAVFGMRSHEVDSFDDTYDGSGHQATYDRDGILIRGSPGVSAGSADRVVPITSGGPIFSGLTHVDADVMPFIWAAQLDGNPCSGNSTPTNMTNPMLYEGSFLRKYMTVRPTIANDKTELNPKNP